MDKNWERWLDNHGDRVFRLSLRLCAGCYADAEDLTQEALIAAFQSRPRFTGRAKVTTFLHAVTVNCWRKRLRATPPQIPLVTMHPDAFRFAWIMELAVAQGRFSSTADAFERNFDTLKTLSDVEVCTRLKLDQANLADTRRNAIERVQTQWDAAKAHGIKETPTFWVRDLQTGDVREATGFRNFQALVSGVQK